jgi:hypothetical protein
MINYIAKTRLIGPLSLFAVLLLLPYTPGLSHLSLSIYVLVSYNYFIWVGTRFYSMVFEVAQKDSTRLLISVVNGWHLQFPAMLIALFFSGSGSILGLVAYNFFIGILAARIDFIILMLLAILLQARLLKSVYNFEDIQNFYIFVNPAIYDRFIPTKDMSSAEFRSVANMTLIQQYIISIIKLFSLSSILLYAFGRLGFLITNDASFSIWQSIQAALSLGPFNVKSNLFTGDNWISFKIVFQILLLIWLAIYVALSDILKPSISEGFRLRQ